LRLQHFGDPEKIFFDLFRGYVVNKFALSFPLFSHNCLHQLIFDHFSLLVDDDFSDKVEMVINHSLNIFDPLLQHIKVESHFLESQVTNVADFFKNYPQLWLLLSFAGMRLQNFQNRRLVDVEIAVDVFEVADGSLVSIE